LPSDWESVLNQFGCFEFELLTHQFMLPLINDISEAYFINERERHRDIYIAPMELTYFTDIDFSLSIFKN